VVTDTDSIGVRGEAILTVALTEPVSGKIIFRPSFLGDKWPLADVVVELVDGPTAGAFFMIQSKATTLGYTKNAPRRIRAAIKKVHLVGLAKFKIPTYVVGINSVDRRAFLVSTIGAHHKGASSLICAYEIDEVVLKGLWDEVADFWKTASVTLKSTFLESRWK
jgi:hypothetical protein